MSMITGRYVCFEGTGYDGPDSITLIQVFTPHEKDGTFRVFAMTDFGVSVPIHRKWDWHVMGEDCVTTEEADAVFNNFKDEMLLSGWDVRCSGLTKLGEY